MEKYEEANALLKKIPDTVIDATIMKTSVLAHQEGTDTAALFLSLIHIYLAPLIFRLLQEVF